MTEKKVPHDRTGRRATGEQKESGQKGSQRDSKSGTFREGKKIKIENVRKEKND